MKSEGNLTLYYLIKITKTQFKLQYLQKNDTDSTIAIFEGSKKKVNFK